MRPKLSAPFVICERQHAIQAGVGGSGLLVAAAPRNDENRRKGCDG